MERKKWLETFIWLADNNRPSIEYRKRLRVMHTQLPVLIKRLPRYRKELADILEAEKREEEKKREEAEAFQRRLEETKREAERRADARFLSLPSEHVSSQDSEGEGLDADRTGVVEPGLSEPSREPSSEGSTSEYGEGSDA